MPHIAHDAESISVSAVPVHDNSDMARYPMFPDLTGQQTFITAVYNIVEEHAIHLHVLICFLFF
jgi:hypothetical protein